MDYVFHIILFSDGNLITQLRASYRTTSCSSSFTLVLSLANAIHLFRPQWKVMFSEASVILFRGGGSLPPPPARGRPSPSGCRPHLEADPPSTDLQRRPPQRSARILLACILVSVERLQSKTSAVCVRCKTGPQ